MVNFDKLKKKGEQKAWQLAKDMADKKLNSNNNQQGQQKPQDQQNGQKQ